MPDSLNAPRAARILTLAAFGLLSTGCPDGPSADQESDAPLRVMDDGQAASGPSPTVAHDASAQAKATKEDSASNPAEDETPKSVEDAAAQAEGSSGPAAKPKPHPGPFLWVKRSSAGVYSKPNPARENKLGYVKRGGKVPVLEAKVEGPDCSKGWYQVASGGYICSHVGTTDEKDNGAKFAPRQPNVEDILPYPYARNSKNGTPLYKSLPSRTQMHEYEPYLPAAKKAKEALRDEKKADAEQMRQAGLGVGGAASQTAASADEKEVPLWEREENLHEVTLEDLRKEADDVLAQRMMKGFYVAVDKTFNWKGRTWYKTSKGLVAPADRFWQTAGSEFHGVELTDEGYHLPVGFVFGANKASPTYEIDADAKQAKSKGTIQRFEAVQLEYDYLQVGKTDYFRTAEGTYIRDRDIRMTTPGPRPKEVGPSERWIDIDISEQTLIVFEGDRPIYATLISSGKESRNKDKDHSTPRGMWRVREKHIVSTMDGNGSAAGDMPYSIEDVPYIMYFHKSYATHAAFWHQNYGSQMSHGCVNLAPLDAKWVFFNADPPLPEGLHGIWSASDRPGSMVVVHD